MSSVTQQQSALRIERLHTLEQFERCVEIQMLTWNYSAGELFPRRTFLLADRIGGQVLGAFAGMHMVAFNVAFPAYRGGMPYLHSQMLAVLPPYRNAGSGRALKLAQRRLAMDDGFRLIEWTFDPLEVKNAFFNLQRLGAVSRRYVRDFYGPSSSPLQGGLPTDRLYAEWWLGSRHVQQALNGELVPQSDGRTVQVPGAIYDWKAQGDPRAANAQQEVRAGLEAAFAQGLIARGYRRDSDGSGNYVLGPPDSEFIADAVVPTASGEKL